MPRRPRTHIDNLPLHIVQRGHNREVCFLTEADYLAYLGWLDEALQQTGCRLHAYILMTNHVHLLITPEKAETVPKLLVSLGRHYVQYFNRLYRRTGTLWDSRYKSSLIEADRLTIYRQFFRSELDNDALGDLRLALDQNQPLGNKRFHEQITRQLGKSTEARPRGRPRKAARENDELGDKQLRLPVDH
jgi:REP element-mobilizing transposase RayT